MHRLVVPLQPIYAIIEKKYRLFYTCQFIRLTLHTNVSNQFSSNAHIVSSERLYKWNRLRRISSHRFSVASEERNPDIFYEDDNEEEERSISILWSGGMKLFKKKLYIVAYKSIHIHWCRIIEKGNKERKEIVVQCYFLVHST